jgi:predicted transcriptional regulator
MSLQPISTLAVNGGNANASNKKAVDLIEKLAYLVTAPPKVIPMFQREVITCNLEDQIAIAIEVMYKNKYSQIPVMKEREMIKLLTANTIVNWLGSCVSDEIFSLMETAVSEVCAYAEDKDNYVIVSKNTNAFELIEIFREFEYSGRRLEAVLINNSGKAHEQLLGIVTIWDLPNVVGASLI